MPFIPHSDSDIREMLAALGIRDLDTLFSEIPGNLRVEKLQGVPAGVGEHEISRLMRERAESDRARLSFLGAGAYEHHIPAAVWELTTRGEFYSAYTPYQAEASQGTLQLIYEYQSMMASLTGMEVSNASLYDGASALAEAALMAIRINRHQRTRRILIPESLHPRYRKVAQTICGPQEIEFVPLDYDHETGQIGGSALDQAPDAAAMVISQPNFFGILEDVDQLTRWARSRKMVVIALVNPISLALLKPPGRWGDRGVDICCGEGQPLGIPLSSGGPYFGFMTTSQTHVRQMPGRLVGRTVDLEGRPGYTLTLQAREQHIRRGKAKSNICTNQGLMVTAATIYMSLLGPEGLRKVAAASHAKTRQLRRQLQRDLTLEPAFSGPYFHETVIDLKAKALPIYEALLREGEVLPGYLMAPDFQDLDRHLLLCATETKTEDDIAKLVAAFAKVLDQGGNDTFAETTDEKGVRR